MVCFNFFYIKPYRTYQHPFTTKQLLTSGRLKPSVYQPNSTSPKFAILVFTHILRPKQQTPPSHSLTHSLTHSFLPSALPHLVSQFVCVCFLQPLASAECCYNGSPVAVKENAGPFYTRALGSAPQALFHDCPDGVILWSISTAAHLLKLAWKSMVCHTQSLACSPDISMHCKCTMPSNECSCR